MTSGALNAATRPTVTSLALNAATRPTVASGSSGHPPHPRRQALLADLPAATIRPAVYPNHLFGRTRYFGHGRFTERTHRACRSAALYTTISTQKGRNLDLLLAAERVESKGKWKLTHVRRRSQAGVRCFMFIPSPPDRVVDRTSLPNQDCTSLPPRLFAFRGRLSVRPTLRRRSRCTTRTSSSRDSSAAKASRARRAPSSGQWSTRPTRCRYRRPRPRRAGGARVGGRCRTSWPTPMATPRAIYKSPARFHVQERTTRTEVSPRSTAWRDVKSSRPGAYAKDSY